MSCPEDKQSFSVTGADSTFRGRSNDVFDSLNVIAAKHSAFEKTLSKTEHSDPDFDSEDEEKEKELRDKKDFKVPSGSAPKGKIIPQHQSTPDNWTHYNLSDVKCSDARNKAAALEFMENLQKAKMKNPDEDEAMDLENSRHTFRKPNLKRNSGDSGGSVKNAKKALGGLDHLAEEVEVEEETEEKEEDVASVAFKRKIRKKVNLRSKDESSEEEEEEEEKEVVKEKEEESSEEEEEEEEDPNDGLT